MDHELRHLKPNHEHRPVPFATLLLLGRSRPISLLRLWFHFSCEVFPQKNKNKKTAAENQISNIGVFHWNGNPQMNFFCNEIIINSQPMRKNSSKIRIITCFVYAPFAKWNWRYIQWLNELTKMCIIYSQWMSQIIGWKTVYIFSSFILVCCAVRRMHVGSGRVEPFWHGMSHLYTSHEMIKWWTFDGIR